MKEESRSHGYTTMTMKAAAAAEIHGGTVRVRGKEGAAIALPAHALIVGRDPSCDVVVEDRKVSSVHLELVASERGVRVRDLGSRNGTYVGRTRIVDGYLVEPSVITVGDTQIDFQPTRPSIADVSEETALGGCASCSRSVGKRRRRT